MEARSTIANNFSVDLTKGVSRETPSFLGYEQKGSGVGARSALGALTQATKGSAQSIYLPGTNS